MKISCGVGQSKLCNFIGSLEFVIRGRKILVGTLKCHSIKGEVTNETEKINFNFILTIQGLVAETSAIKVEVVEGYLSAFSVPPPPPTTDEKIINMAKSQFSIVAGLEYALFTFGAFVNIN